jgi:isopenicillin N synthase-like dioxygenase
VACIVVIDSIGALAVRGIPNWMDMREKTLPMSHRLAKLPKDQLDELEDENSMFNAGWSFGKEKMGDTPDFAKASFYYNPLLDDPSPELREAYPWALPKNRWPQESSIPQFRDNCREIGIEMKTVASLLSKHIDRLLVAQVPGYEAGLFAQAMEQTTKAKARMLYYYPITPPSSASTEEVKTKDNWIAWHNDSGFLTCLAGEIFVDHDSGEVISNPEPDTAGLWIADR